MKPTIILKPHRAAISSFVFSFALVSLSLAAPPEGKGGGKGGGDEDPPTEPPSTPVTLRETAPVDYWKRELVWGEGVEVYVNGVNRHGRSVGFVRIPDLNGGEAYRKGFVSEPDPLDPDVIQVLDLNDEFGTALSALNGTDPDPWRIAYGRAINDDGLIACMLLRSSAPRRYNIREAGYFDGIDPTPMLVAVASLVDGTIELVDLDESSEYNSPRFNQAGDLLVQSDRVYPTERGVSVWGEVHTLYLRETGGYRKVDLPGVVNLGSSFNSALEIAFATQQVASDLYRREFLDLSVDPPVYEDTLLGTGSTKGKDPDYFWVQGISEGFVDEQGAAVPGAVYVSRNNSDADGIYRITESGEEFIAPTTDEGAVFSIYNYMSLAPYGSEELLLQEHPAGHEFPGWQIYQPDLGARFELPFDLMTADEVDLAAISAPNGPIGPEGYHGGHIVFPTNTVPTRSFLLTPVAPATP